MVVVAACCGVVMVVVFDKAISGGWASELESKSIEAQHAEMSCFWYSVDVNGGVELGVVLRKLIMRKGRKQVGMLVIGLGRDRVSVGVVRVTCGYRYKELGRYASCCIWRCRALFVIVVAVLDGVSQSAS